MLTNVSIFAVPLKKEKEKSHQHCVWTLSVVFGQCMFGDGGQ